MTTFDDVDAYIAAAPKEARLTLAQLRKAVRPAAPRADEGIRYARQAVPTGLVTTRVRAPARRNEARAGSRRRS